MPLGARLRHAYARALESPENLHPSEAASAGLDVRDSVGALEERIRAYGLWRGLARHFWKQSLGYLILGIGVIIAGPAMPWAIAQTMSIMGTGSPKLVLAAGLLSLATLAYTLLRWASTWQVRMLVYRIDLSMQRIIFRRLQRTDPRWLAQQKKSSSSFLLEYPQQMSQVAFAVEFIVYTVLMFVLIACLIVWHGIAGVAVLVMILSGTALSKWLIDRDTNATKTYVDGDHARAGLVDVLVSAWEPIRRQHLEALVASCFDRVRSDQERYLKRRALRSAWTKSVTHVLPLAAVWAAVAVGVFAGAGLAVGEGVALLVLVRLLMTVVSENLATYATLRFGWSMGADVTRLLTQAPTINDTGDADLPPGSVVATKHDEDPLVIDPGSRVAIVARDESDTTALLHRIAGVPGAGGDWSVRHGGEMALVQRGQPTFDGTIAQSVTLWCDVDRERYVQAHNNSGMLSALAERDGGDTSTLSSTSQRISEGQNVRISLAQALATQPDLLLLDDVFAPLDPQLADTVAQRVLSDDEPATRLFTTTRVELARYAQQLLIVDGDRWLQVDPAHVEQYREELSDMLGAESAGSLLAALNREPCGEREETAQADDCLRYQPTTEYAPPPTEAHEAKVKAARPADLLRNVRGLFPVWAIATVLVMAVAMIVTEYALAGIVDQGVGTAKLVWFLAALILMGGAMAWLRGYLELRSPMSAIARIHTGLIEGLFSGRNDARNSSAAGRISRDFFSLEIRIPSQMSGFAGAWLTVVVATATVAVTGWITIVPLTLLALGGLWAYRRGRAALVAAVQLSASCRGPLLSFGRDALGTNAFHTSPALRGALSRRFDDLGSIRGVGMLRLSWVQLRTLLTVELLGLGFFLTTLWALVAVDGATVVAAGVIIYAAYTFSQQVAMLVENMQGMDTTLLMIGRIADSLGAQTLPSRSRARHSIPDDAEAMAAALLRPQARTGETERGLHTRQLRLAMPEGVRAPAGVDLSVAPGSFTVVSGPSGIGKSTLLRTVSGARAPESGDIQLSQHVPDVLGLRTRTHCRYIESDLPQLPLTAVELLEEASPNGVALLDSLAAAAGSAPVDRETPVGDLDHARRQLVNLARGFADRPDVVFCDEATSALGTATERTVYAALREYAPATALVAVLHRVDNQDLADDRIEIVPPQPSYPAP